MQIFNIVLNEIIVETKLHIIHKWTLNNQLVALQIIIFSFPHPLFFTSLKICKHNFFYPSCC